MDSAGRTIHLHRCPTRNDGRVRSYTVALWLRGLYLKAYIFVGFVSEDELSCDVLIPAEVDCLSQRQLCEHSTTDSNVSAWDSNVGSSSNTKLRTWKSKVLLRLAQFIERLDVQRRFVGHRALVKTCSTAVL